MQVERWQVGRLEGLPDATVLRARGRKGSSDGRDRDGTVNGERMWSSRRRGIVTVRVGAVKNGGRALVPVLADARPLATRRTILKTSWVSRFGSTWIVD